MRVIGDYISYHYFYFFKHLKLNLYFFSGNKIFHFGFYFTAHSTRALLGWNDETFDTDIRKGITNREGTERKNINDLVN